MTDSVFKANLAHLGGAQLLGRLTAGLRRWRDRWAAAHPRLRLDVLSMGMSGDFPIAIEEGATRIRIGTALFGPRRKPGQTPSDEAGGA